MTLQAGERRDLALQLAALTGTVVVRALPAEAVLSVNGTAQPAAPDGVHELRLTTRPQRIELQLPGYAGYRNTITPRAGLSQELRVRLLTIEEARAGSTQAPHHGGQRPGTRALEGGSVAMGASRREPGRRANEPQRDVTVTRLYYLATTEVTNAQYRAFSANHDSGSYEEQSLDKGRAAGHERALDRTRRATATGSPNRTNWRPTTGIRQGTLEGTNPSALATACRRRRSGRWRRRRVDGGGAPAALPLGTPAARRRTGTGTTPTAPPRTSSGASSSGTTTTSW